MEGGTAIEDVATAADAADSADAGGAEARASTRGGSIQGD